MSDENADGTWLKKIETRLPLIIGIGEILLGIALVSVKSPNALLPWIIPSGITSVLSELGIGLIAAGIITITLEPFSRMRIQNDIEQIKTAHFEAVLQGVMPKEIFDQVESQIIRQPFLRRDMRTLFALKWRDRDKHILTKKTTSIYSISNISRAEATFNLTASIDLEIDTQYHDETRFQEIRVQRGNSHDSVYTEEQIRQEGIEVRSDRSVSLKIPVRLQPREEIKVSLKYDSIVSNRYAILVTTIPTIGFELAIDHEPDMAVKVDILYPFADSFRELISDDTYKSWRIDDGMLPMQGFELTWHRTSIATDGE